jgi:oxidase EvaA
LFFTVNKKFSYAYPQFGALPTEQGFIRSIDDALQWLDDTKASNHFWVKRNGLNELKEWGLDRDGSFSHNQGRFFRVIGIKVVGQSREVKSWCQPILDNPGHGIIGLLVRKYAGEHYFLMHAKAEVGNRNVVQIAPTVQFTPGNYIGNSRLPKPFLFDAFCGSKIFPVVTESLQSEEGARFFKESHHNRILQLPEGVKLDLPPDYRWISTGHLSFLLGMGGRVNSCARSVLALMLHAEAGR